MAELWLGGPIELPHTITVDGVVLHLPAVPTARLLHWLATGAWTELLPNLLSREQRLPLMLRLYDEDDPFDLEHLWVAATAVLGRLAGLSSAEVNGYWPAWRLAATAHARWPQYVAWCVTHGTEPVGGPLWRVVGGIYGWLADGHDEEGLSKLDDQLWTPPVHTAVQVLPRHVRDEEARLALAALAEQMPGDVGFEQEWSPTSSPD